MGHNRSYRHIPLYEVRLGRQISAATPAARCGRCVYTWKFRHTGTRQWRDQAYPFWRSLLSPFRIWVVQFTSIHSPFTPIACTPPTLAINRLHGLTHTLLWQAVGQAIDLHFAISEVDQWAILPCNVYISVGYLATMGRLPLVNNLCPQWSFSLAWPEGRRPSQQHVSLSLLVERSETLWIKVKFLLVKFVYVAQAIVRVWLCEIILVKKLSGAQC